MSRVTHMGRVGTSGRMCWLLFGIYLCMCAATACAASTCPACLTVTARIKRKSSTHMKRVRNESCYAQEESEEYWGVCDNKCTSCTHGERSEQHIRNVVVNVHSHMVRGVRNVGACVHLFFCVRILYTCTATTMLLHSVLPVDLVRATPGMNERVVPIMND